MHAPELQDPEQGSPYTLCIASIIPWMLRITISPATGIFDEMVAAGPVPALVMALTLKVYEEKGLKPDTSQEVASVFCTGISPEGPSICILYPVMIPFLFSS